MITRLALFQGSIRNGEIAGFRKAIIDRLVPLWKQFPGSSDVRVMFSEERDAGAPEFPLILAVTYPDIETMNGALDSPVRYQSKEVTGEIVGEFFDGIIHHHVTQANIYPL